MALQFVKKRIRKGPVNIMTSQIKNMPKKVVETVVKDSQAIEVVDVEVSQDINSKKKNNNKKKSKEDMIDVNKINDIEAVIEKMQPEVKVVKTDRGLIERTESSKIIITEDNRQVLID
jgi:hypothetical protein